MSIGRTPMEIVLLPWLRGHGFTLASPRLVIP
jgi:hypothetical protein